ncbi:MAG: hypothetical protein QGF59_18230, partial [Pirellulaceae bacterium]|nr:hypothetical protein [Pirellulaceae bacterium]
MNPILMKLGLTVSRALQRYLQEEKVPMFAPASAQATALGQRLAAPPRPDGEVPRIQAIRWEQHLQSRPAT